MPIVVEAFLGAIYIDHGFKVAKKVALSWLNWIFKDLPDLEVNDYKSQLQELIQSDSREPLRYVEIKSLEVTITKLSILKWYITA